MAIDLERLEGLLAEARRCEAERAGYVERAAHTRRSAQAAGKAGEPKEWLDELAAMAADFAARSEEAARQCRDLEHEIRQEISRLEKLTGYSPAEQLALARYLDEHGRDGTPQAQRAVLLSAPSVEATLDLCRYLEEKGCLADATQAARDGWQRFRARVLRVRWEDLLARAGETRELIELLTDDLRQDPGNLALLERLAGLQLQVGDRRGAVATMERALDHPAGGTRLLGSFMAALVTAGQTATAVELAGRYLREQVRDEGPAAAGHAAAGRAAAGRAAAGRAAVGRAAASRAAGGKMAVRRELAEGLRRSHMLEAAVAFLDSQAAEAPGDRDLAGYIPNFLVSSLRSEDWAVRQSALALLRRRRDAAVEEQLVKIYTDTKGDELRLLVIDSLVTIQSREALPFLEEAAACSSRRVRLAGARAIGAVCGEGAEEQGGGGAGDARLLPCLPAIKALLARLAVEEDEGVRQALIQALHAADPRPRRAWERLTGRRRWAEPAPEAGRLPTVEQRRRRTALLSVALLAVALAGLALAPIEPSPRKEAERVLGQGIALAKTQIAKRQATPTPAPTPTVTPTAVAAGLDNRASGRVSEILGADTVRMQVAGQTVTVRYLGIVAPATGQPGARAAMDANRSLVIGRMVYLEQGSTAADPEGRWLRYVWLPENQLASEQMLAMGYAAPSGDPQETKYQQRLADAATKAWKNKKGFWSGGSDIFPMVAVKSDQANIREGPGTEQPVKLQAPQGTVLAALRRTAASDWIEVRVAGNQEGWISSQVVETTAPISSLPAK